MNRSIPLSVVTMILPAVALAGPAENKGLEIAREADRRDTGFGDTKAELVMILRNKRRQESTRELEMWILEVEGGGDKSLTIFHSPRDVRGTALLTYSHGTKPDDQWLYLPALRRVKRIASNNKSGSFMGSEFAYEDLASHEVEKYTYRHVEDERINAIDCFVIERYPVDRRSGYTKQRVWIDREEYRAQRIDYYDRKGQLLKTYSPTGYRKYVGKYWRPDRMHMVNHQTGKSTELIWSNYQFKAGLEEDDFTRTRLTQVL